MKKAAVITFLHNMNYGSTLQAWALQQALSELGWDAVHLDYAPGKKEKLLNLLRSGNSPSLILEGMRKRSAHAAQQGAAPKKEAFRRFYQEEMKLTAPCGDAAALRQACAGMDLLIAGSDQIWSPVWLNPVYYLTFAGAQKKVAYAPSFGVDHMTSPAKGRRIAGWLREFDALSVREQEGAGIIRTLTGLEAPVLPDPVMLVSREKWLQLASPCQQDRPYLACYLIGDRPEYRDQILMEAERTGLTPLVIPITDSALSWGFQTAEGLGPKEWLGCLAGASHVLTDSFHGAAFSCILGRELQILRRYSEDDPESKNSRVDQLARSLGLTGGRAAENEAADRVSALREQGLSWLRSQLEQCG